MTAQHLNALGIANSVKARRRALRRDLAERELGAADLILGDWPCIERAMVGVVLSWLPSVGDYCSNRICRRANVPYGQRFGGLSQLKRRALLRAIGEIRPTVLSDA